MDYYEYKDINPALDYGRIIENMGKVDEETLARITEAVQVQVGVYDKYNG